MSQDDPTEIVTFIRYHGCASHTSASSHQRIEAAERIEKMIRDFGINRFYISMNGIDKAIALLRAGEKV